MELENKNNTQALSLQVELGTRIGEVADLIGTRKYASKIAGVSDDMLFRYIRGTSKQSFVAVGRLCEEASASIEWVWSGKGEMKLKKNQMLNARSQQLKYLLEALLLTEQALEGVPHGLSPTKKVELVENVAEILKTDTQASNEMKPHLIQIVKVLALTHINQVEE